MQAAKNSASKNSFLLIPYISSNYIINYNIVSHAIANSCGKIIVPILANTVCPWVSCLNRFAGFFVVLFCCHEFIISQSEQLAFSFSGISQHILCIIHFICCQTHSAFFVAYIAVYSLIVSNQFFSVCKGKCLCVCHSVFRCHVFIIPVKPTKSQVCENTT